MKRMKKVAVLLMTMALCLGMAGCKKETSDEVPTGDVYSPTFSEVSSDVEYISSVMSNGNEIQLLGQRYEGESYELHQMLMTIDAATGEKSSRELSFDSDVENESSSLQTLVRYKDGYMAAMYHYTEPTEEEIESGNYNDNYYYDIVLLDSDFNRLSTISLEELSKKVEEESGGFYVQYVAGDAEGNIYLSLDNVVFVIDDTGKQLARIDFENWINGMVATADGQVLVMYYDDQYNMQIAPVDMNTKALGAAFENLPVIDNGSSYIFPAAEGKLYMASSTKLYLYDIASQTAEEILDWVACDINANNLSGFAALEDGSFVAVSTTYDYSDDTPETTIELASIKKVPASSVKQKKPVTLASLTMNYDIQEKVIKFNRTNEEYRINVKTYVKEDGSNWEDAETQFLADVAAGTAGDFFIASDSNINVDNLIAKGALADLSKLIDEDAELSKDDFIPNMLEVLSTDGKLYSIAESFYVQTLVGKTADVGTGKSWTFKEVMALLEARPDSQLMMYATKSSALSMMVMYGMDSFYNAETGECTFDSEDFVTLLELCNTFPKEYDYSAMEETSLPKMLRSGKVLLSDVYMSDFDEIQLYSELYGEPVNFIGYPTNNGSGSVVSFYNRFCIAAKSKNKDGAWAFIRQFILPEAQQKLDWRFPINGAAFEQRITDAMQEDENSSGIWMYDDVEIEIGALTEEAAQLVRDIVYGVTTEANYDQQLLNIITEEAEYFFGGEKSAKEIAGIIQSRAQLYIDENR